MTFSTRTRTITKTQLISYLNDCENGSQLLGVLDVLKMNAFKVKN